MNESFKKIWDTIKAQDNTTALDLLEKLEPLAPDDRRNQKALLVMVLAKLGRYRQALEHAIYIINQPNPTSYDFNSLGNLYHRMGNEPLAEDAYLNALKLDPNYVNAYFNLANAYYKKNDLKLATDYYQKILSFEPLHIDACYQLSCIYLLENNPKKALSIIEPLLPQDENNFKILNQWSQCQYLLENYELIITKFSEHPFQSIQENDSQWYLASAYFKLNQFQESLKHALDIKIHNPLYSQIHELIAHCYFNLKNHDEAFKFYLLENEYSKNPDNYYNIAILLERKQRQNEAINYYKETIKLDPSYVAAYLNMGNMYLSQGSFELAKDAYSKAYSLNPDSNDLKFILSALDSENFTPQDIPPSSFIQNLFDQYAPYYDRHLTQTLRFRVPQLLIKILEEHDVIQDHKKLSVLDLGCGSGMMGELLSPYVSLLIGIDLSNSMLEIAKAKDCYQKLIHSDYLNVKHEELFDLITASDFVPYLGNVNTLFDYCKENLKPQGFLCFSYETVEQENEQDFILDKTLRYKHSSAFIQKLLNGHHFKVIHSEKAVLRHNHKKPIDGEIVLAQLR